VIAGANGSRCCCLAAVPSILADGLRILFSQNQELSLDPEDPSGADCSGAVVIAYAERREIDFFSVIVFFDYK
jgi:hypothetical protein